MKWKEAIKAVQNNDVDWIRSNHLEFKQFFKTSNLKSQGKLNEQALNAHYDSQLFKMYVGAEFNGLGLPLNEGAKWIENASKLDGNWGWLLGIGVGGAYFIDYMTIEAAEEFFKPKNALVAGSGMPNGKAKQTGGQWEITGSWNFCSGCEQASMFTAVVQKDENFKALVMHPSQAEIVPTWDVPGMQLTCSHTIKTDPAKIRSYQFFDLMEAPRSSKYPLSKYPFMQFAQVCFAPVIAGISYSIFTEAKAILKLKSKSWQSRQPERVEFLQNVINDFFDEYANYSAAFYRKVEKSWSDLVNGKTVNAKEVEQNALEWAAHCYESVAKMLPYLGMSVLEKHHPVHLMWQNLQVGFQHSSLRKY